jgi:hypothetical protein
VVWRRTCREIDLAAEVVEAVLGALVHLDAGARGIVGHQELHRAAALRAVEGDGSVRHEGRDPSTGRFMVVVK